MPLETGPGALVVLGEVSQDWKAPVMGKRLEHAAVMVEPSGPGTFGFCSLLSSQNVRGA